MTTDNYFALQLEGSTVYLKDCTIDCGSSSAGAISVSSSRSAPGILTLSGAVTILGSGNKGIQADGASTVTCLAGTYSFDPTAYVDASSFSVTESGGIWTVTGK